jgi:hypothetical protein
MRTDKTSRRRLLYRAGAVIVLAIVLLLAASSLGTASSKAAPQNTSPPTISGTAQAGRPLSGGLGTWTNNATGFRYGFIRCDRNGGGCAGIGVNTKTYTLTAADVGHTMRFRVTAANADGSTVATSDATPVVAARGKPVNTSPPTISGTAQEGKTLTGSLGAWSNAASSSSGFIRCDGKGGSCAGVGANGQTYTLTARDVGHTMRFRVTATNPDGSTVATSAATAVVTAARAPGCPAGGNPDQVTAIESPARLIVDGLNSDPAVAGSGTQTLTVRFHVSSTCGGPVQGALVYATAVPYNQFAAPAESATGADGWVTLVFQRRQGFPVSSHQQLITIFVRARKPGENLLAGISSRRLVSLRVRLSV